MTFYIYKELPGEPIGRFEFVYTVSARDIEAAMKHWISAIHPSTKDGLRVIVLSESKNDMRLFKLQTRSDAFEVSGI